MKYRTKKQRSMALINAYCEVHGKAGVTTHEVAMWCVRNDLWPIPKRGDDEVACESWERRLSEVVLTSGVMS